MSPVFHILIGLVVAVTMGKTSTPATRADYCRAALKIARPRNCMDLICRGYTDSGVYTIYPNGGEFFSFNVFCDQKTAGGGWIVFQRRIDPFTDFFKNWQMYKLGFGSLIGNFWLGNEKLHMLLSKPKRNHELWVDLEGFPRGDIKAPIKKHAEYSHFYVYNEHAGYKLSVAGYKGNAGDSFSRHNGFRFSTFDYDNDNKKSFSCAKLFQGAWWYDRCLMSNLNAYYYPTPEEGSSADGIVWKTFNKSTFESLQTTEMKFRPSLS